MHAARHRFMRPIWLCDLAAAIESVRRPRLGCHSGRTYAHTDVVARSLWLANHLLNLSLPTHIKEVIGASRWLEMPILLRWGGAQPRSASTPAHRVARALQRHDLGTALAAGLEAWTDRLEAAAELGWPFMPAPAAAAVPILLGRRAVQLLRGFRTIRVRRERNLTRYAFHM